MGSKTQNLNCPACLTRLTFPPESLSPFIRCGKCDTLFRIEPKADAPATDPRPNRKSSRVAPGVQYSNLYGDNQTPQPAIRQSLAHPRNRRQTSMPWSSLFVGGVLLFGSIVLFVDWISYQSSKTTERRVRQRLVTQPYHVTQSFTAAELRNWADESGVPKLQIDLSTQSSANLSFFSVHVDSLIRDRRPLTAAQCRSLERYDEIRKIQFSNLKLNGPMRRFIESRTVVVLDLHGATFDEESQLVFSNIKFPFLGSLNLADTNISGWEIRRIRSCSFLRHLNLRNTQIGNAAIQPVLQHPYLKTLDLVGTKVTYAALRELSCPNLRVLKLSADAVSLAERQLIESANPKLQVISL